jgi:hypothetical protein
MRFWRGALPKVSPLITFAEETGLREMRIVEQCFQGYGTA